MTVEGEFFGGEDPSRPDGLGPPDESRAGMSQSIAERPSFVALLRAGMRSLRRFPGLIAVLYVVQLALSTAAWLAMTLLLVWTFGARPLFDRAMDGDLAALVTCLTDPDGANALAGTVGIGIAAVLLYGLVSWYLTAGLIAVFLDAPSRGREVARWFGAAGTANFFPFLRLSLWSTVPYAVVMLALWLGIGWIAGKIQYALEPSQVVRAIAIGLCPALLLHWVAAAAVDYARVDLVRHPGLSSARALVRGFQLVAHHWLALLHTLLYGAVFAGMMALYAWLGDAAAAWGVVGLIALRQVVGLTRFAAHVALIAGQVEIACAVAAAPLSRRA